MNVEKTLIVKGVRVYINPQTLLYFATCCGHNLVFTEL
jgi:hypothetical protein